MTRNPSRLGNIAASLVLMLLGIFLVISIFPQQIPGGLPGDVSSGHYPRFIMFVWIIAACIWFISALTGAMDGDGEDEATHVSRRSFYIMIVVAVGYAIFATIGFLAAGFVLIVVLSNLCGERGWAPWALAAIAPACVFLFLDKALDVTLPTILLP